MESIALAAQVSKRTLYTRFQSRNDLLETAAKPQGLVVAPGTNRNEPSPQG